MTEIKELNQLTNNFNHILIKIGGILREFDQIPKMSIFE